MHLKPRSQKSISAQDKKLRIQRQRDPIREARRQHNLSRARHRVMDYVPTYQQIMNGNTVTAQRYLKHVPIYRVH